MRSTPKGPDLRFNTCQGVNLRKGRTVIFMTATYRLALRSEDGVYTPRHWRRFPARRFL
jgi:hypothetical protein